MSTLRTKILHALAEVRDPYEHEVEPAVVIVTIALRVEGQADPEAYVTRWLDHVADAAPKDVTWIEDEVERESTKLYIKRER